MFKSLNDLNMYISDDNIILNDFEKKAVEKYCFDKLHSYNDLYEDEFIHQYEDDVNEKGLNVYYDGRVDFNWEYDDNIIVCFHCQIFKDNKGRVKRGDQEFLSCHPSKIEVKGCSYDKAKEILKLKEVKEIIEVLDEVYCNVWNTEGTFAYYFGNGGLKSW